MRWQRHGDPRPGSNGSRGRRNEARDDHGGDHTAKRCDNGAECCHNGTERRDNRARCECCSNRTEHDGQCDDSRE